MARALLSEWQLWPSEAPMGKVFISHRATAGSTACSLVGATADPMPGDLEYYVFKRGEQQLCAVMQTDPAWRVFPPQWITYFGVADADAALAAVTVNGGKILSPIEPTPFGAGAHPAAALPQPPTCHCP